MASAFLQGFTGGMNAMTNMINAREDRAFRQQQYQNQLEQQKYQRGREEKLDSMRQQEWDMKMQQFENLEANQKATAVLHYLNKMDPEGQKEVTGFVVNELNSRPEIITMLQRDVPEGHEKRVSQQFGEFEKGGFSLMVDTVNKETGEVVKTGPLTEEGHNDGSDKPVYVSYDDFQNFLGQVPGLAAKTLNLEMGILSRGGQLPGSGQGEGTKKIDSWTDSETGNRYMISQRGGQQILTATMPDGSVVERPITGGSNINDLFGSFFSGEGIEGGKETPKPEAKPEQSGQQPKAKSEPAPDPSEIVANLKTYGPSAETVSQGASHLWQGMKRGATNWHRRGQAAGLYTQMFKGSGKRLDQDPEAMAALEQFTEANNGAAPDEDQIKALFAELRKHRGRLRAGAGGMQS